MRGFFDIPTPAKAAQPKTPRGAVGCDACGLKNRTLSPNIPPTGEGKLKTFILGEASGEREDQLNNQFIGETGHFLRKCFRIMGYDLDRDFRKTNAVACFVYHQVPIFTIDGYKPVSKVKVGDLVLTHKGRFRKVISRIQDLPKHLKRITEEVYKIKVGRINSPYKNRSLKEFVVTSSHRFLSKIDNKENWVYARQLNKGDRIIAIGEKCIICGGIFFKTNSYGENICSLICESKYLEDKYGEKLREKAHEKVRRSAKLGVWGKMTGGKVTKEAKLKGRIKWAKIKESENKLSSISPITIGFGEGSLANHLSDKKIQFISQFAIETLNYDFFLPKYNLLVEVDNPDRNGQKSVKNDQTKKNILAKNYNYELLRVSSKNPISPIERLIKNHNQEYQFTEVEIVSIEKIPIGKRMSLTCIEVEEDNSFIANRVIHHNCRPTNEKGSNRTPTTREIKACEPNWRAAIQQFQPKYILLFGAKAVEAFFMNRTQPISTNLSIGRWRKLCIPDVQTKAWVIPLYHPSFVIRNPDAENIFKLDLQWAMEQITSNLPEIEEIDYSQKIKCLTNTDEILDILKTIKEQKPTIAFDYETTGLRPYYPGHSIVSTAVAIYGEDIAYAWPYSYPGAWQSGQLEALNKAWRGVLSDPEILKVAQNIQMEHPWSKIIIGEEPKGWYWDTMVCSHIVDERAGFTGLDFQTFINWGYEYGGDISKFKKALPGTKFNTMQKCPLNELLKYNGLDAYFTMRLAERQWDFMDKGNKESLAASKAYDLFHKGVLAFSDMEMEGISVNVEYYQDTQIKLEKRLDFLEKQLLRSPEAKLFKSKTGREIKLTSSDDMKKLLFEFLGVKSIKKTEGGGDSVDKDVVESLDIPFAKDLVKKRKLDKLKTTYIDGILDLQVNKKLHPNSNLHLVRTGRSSMDSPNMQNIPKRDKESMTMVRNGIIPSPGNLLAEADYGGHEVGILACYSKDPVLMKERIDGADIHQEWADFLQLKGFDAKIMRFDAKNAMVFALFYGSYYKNIHADLISRGYHDLPIMRVQKAEREFWLKYRGIKKFQDGLIKSYQQNGYVEMMHGFRRRGFLTKNEIINSVIQGTAFHVLLESIIKINEISKEEKWKSKLIGQIHDSIIIDTNPNEIDHVIETTKKVMTKDVLANNPWIIVPLISDIKIGKINQSWDFLV